MSGWKVWKIWAVALVLLGVPRLSPAQGLTVGLLDCRQHRIMAAATAEYVELDNQYNRVTVQFLQPGLTGAVSPWTWLTFGAGVSYGPVILGLRGFDDQKSKPNYQISGTVMLGPLPLVPPVFSVAAVAWGQFLQAYTHEDTPRQIGGTFWTEKREHLYTGYFASAGLALVSKFGRFLFFIGPSANKDFQVVRSRRILSDGQQTFGLEKSYWDARSEVAYGAFGGFGVQLPARFSITASVRMNYRNQIAAMISLAQAGSP